MVRGAVGADRADDRVRRRLAIAIAIALACTATTRCGNGRWTTGPIRSTDGSARCNAQRPPGRGLRRSAVSSRRWRATRPPMRQRPASTSTAAARNRTGHGLLPGPVPGTGGARRAAGGRCGDAAGAARSSECSPSGRWAVAPAGTGGGPSLHGSSSSTLSTVRYRSPLLRGRTSVPTMNRRSSGNSNSLRFFNSCTGPVSPRLPMSVRALSRASFPDDGSRTARFSRRLRFQAAAHVAASIRCPAIPRSSIMYGSMTRSTAAGKSIGLRGVPDARPTRARCRRRARRDLLTAVDSPMPLDQMYAFCLLRPGDRPTTSDGIPTDVPGSRAHEDAGSHQLLVVESSGASTSRS